MTVPACGDGKVQDGKIFAASLAFRVVLLGTFSKADSHKVFLTRNLLGGVL